MSQKCYAYLEDIRGSTTAEEKRPFTKSAWFRRGWTLQELIAPSEVVFFDHDWHKIGRKVDLANTIASVPHVDEDILRDALHVRTTSVAEKMSWAAGRETTREEDRAYSPLGLFGTNMPLLYGERRRAFLRLQEEIMRTANDQSIMSWNGFTLATGILAQSPDQFTGLPPCYPVDSDLFHNVFKVQDPEPHYSRTNSGLDIQLPIAPIPKYPGYYYGFLACSTSKDIETIVDSNTEWPVIYLHQRRTSTKQYTRTSFRDQMTCFKQISDLQIQTSHLWLSVHEDICYYSYFCCYSGV
ncbi:hypothetical protein BX600DRAFT_503403 [Xylariales sp. PMI_506]|nr:hypothetical protein BX600DRAFT_503403 [Xylariales sp. PMI_506]